MSRPPEIQFDKLKHRVKWAIDANVVSVSSKDCILTIIPYLREKFLEYKAYKDEVMSDNINNALSQIAAELASKTDVAVAKQVVMSLNQSRNISGSKRTMPDEGSEPNETLPVIPSEPVNPSSENKEGKDNKPNGKAGTKKAPRIEGTADAPKEVKERKSPFSFPTPTQRLRDIAGVDSILTTLQKVVFMPVKNPNWVSEVNLALKSSILIHGPAGCGKTLLANAVAGELGLPYFETSGPDLISSMSGDSEKNIKDLFAAAMAAAPSVLFIDGFDAIAAGGESSKNMDRRMVETLSKCLRNVKNGCVSTAPSKPEEVVAAAPNDSSSIIIDENTNKEQVVVTDSGNNTKTITNVDAAHKTVVVIAATSRLDAIESRIRGLFAADIGIPIPSETARTAILRRITINARLSASVDFDLLGKKSPGYVGADLENLCEEAVRQACLRRQQQQSSSTALTESTTVTEMNVVGENSTLEAVDGLKLEQQDFLLALKQIVPTAKKEGFAMPPNVTWKDVGALQETRNQIMKHVLGPMLHREEYSKLGLTASAGVMFFGPPGCGKTLLAKVLANSSRANFISVKGPELLNQYVGQSEAQVRQVFERASQTKPCVIFFDEIDALVPRRSSGSDGSGNRVTDRVVNQLLTELDGVTAREDVYVIGATNRLDTLDPAILRPGRLGTLLYVPLPDERDRVSILRALLRTRAVRWKFGPKSTSDSNQVVIDENGVDVHYVAKNTDGFSGADLKALVDSAAGVIAEEFLLAESLKNDPELQELLYSNIEEDDAPTSSIVPQFSTGENDTKEICMKLCGRHFVKALQEVRPSVAEDERRRFARIDAKIRAGIPAVEAIQQVTKEEENE